jgi:hypothetical protein
MGPMMQTITIRSIPLNEVDQWLDCSLCGPLGTSPIADAHQAALAHLNGHGIETDQAATQV